MINFKFEFNLFNDSYYFYERLLVLAASLIPTIILACFILYTDKKNKEPIKNIIICLLSGILTTALASYLEGIAAKFITNEVLLTYIWALIEELSKIAIFFMFIFDNKYYDEIYDSIVYMTLIALSFAGVENIMYAFSESTVSNSIGLALMRDFTTIPLHVICGVIIAYYLSLGNFSKDKNKKVKNFFLAGVIASLVHGTFNLLMTVISAFSVGNKTFLGVFFFQTLPLLLIMIGLFYLAIKFSRKTLKLNEIFLSNGTYDKKYDYLMTYDEFYNSSSKNKRDKMYMLTSLKSKKEDNTAEKENENNDDISTNQGSTLNNYLNKIDEENEKVNEEVNNDDETLIDLNLLISKIEAMEGNVLAQNKISEDKESNDEKKDALVENEIDDLFGSYFDKLGNKKNKKEEKTISSNKTASKTNNNQKKNSNKKKSNNKKYYKTNNKRKYNHNKKNRNDKNAK